MRGFTLVELAVVVAVIGVVAAISSGALGHAFGSRQVREAGAGGQQIDGALLDFARNNHRLPCPDINGNALEGDASGTCGAGVELGYLPYESLGLATPSTHARAVYAVYRNASIGADLVAPSGTPTRTDLQHALVAADSVIAVSADHVYVTGDGAASGAVDCSSNRVLHPAYAVILPGSDRDGDGSALDGVDAGLPASGHCLASPNQAPDTLFDDHVVFTGFSTLLGLISIDSP